MPTRHLRVPFAVIGGGLGGTAAAVTAARLGLPVVLTEATDWLGGQLTSQGVPPDEHEWIDRQRISPSYSELRDRIRDHYRREYPLTERARTTVALNPGAGFVSRLCAEPRVAHLAVREMTSPLEASGLLTVLTEHEPIEVHREGDRITGVLLRDLRTGDEVLVEAELVADATELGDLLELGDVAHVVGAEGVGDTGELHAPAEARPDDQQAVTWCAALELRPGESHVIARPEGYDRWRTTVPSFWPGPQLSWEDVDPITLERRERPIFAGRPTDAIDGDDLDLWHYRRILARRMMHEDWAGHDVTLVNWPQVDYWDRPLIGVTPSAQRLAMAEARELTLSFVHWIQTEAPRTDGGEGYPELALRGDVLGTTDGLAKAVYVRESRRIKARFTVTEGHIGREMRGDGAGSALFDDSVGIGFYRIDLHPSTGGRTYVDIDCFPFQIPLGALLPVDTENLLAANKNIGTTHITNGAYRLHPVEWSIGEAAGALAAFCATERVRPAQVYEDPARREEYRGLLSGRLGIALAWSDEIRTGGSRSEAVVTAR
ncbi:FAD-dependent oxidoreductase [Cnuibacter physcomitrellae]|uniref:FAD-dependent oxidoreductase n=1 Tax=Cnuibacter physcomitrellae TaxID=1619308 RepID=A0A1X9LIV2_9MICO|nr:FAD-dependent oxidoreductase [Cnuibacter physcomitrellae]ARJ03861.1 FAD-dependent oxidoreductase [Cnuibacter physcomitrellae]GGI39676.1 FAD-dependent oxidoreductase [Cnuibacter physcomitrellae]